MTTCPVCESAIEMPESPRLSEIHECADCRSELEVVALDPIMLALAPEVEEDWGE